MTIAERDDEQHEQHLGNTRFEYHTHHPYHYGDHSHHDEVVLAFFAQVRVLGRARVLGALVMSQLSPVALYHKGRHAHTCWVSMLRRALGDQRTTRRNPGSSCTTTPPWWMSSS